MDRDRRPIGRGVFDKRAQMRNLKDQMQFGHPTGLPTKLLGFFAPLPPMKHLPPMPKRKPKVPYSGIAAYTEHFAKPGDEEYQPEAPDRPPEPRLFRNREFPAQARVDIETKPEKYVSGARRRSPCP